MNKKLSKEIVVRALRTQQRSGVNTYAMFLPGSAILEIADISRIERDDTGELRGFQRKGIRSHVQSIIEYLDQGDVLFPNAIILSLGTDLKFNQARGRDPDGVLDVSVVGTLHIPILEEGKRLAWIVDGQQRSLALSETSNKNLPVPVVAFISPDMEIQREQFILVNKARPLPSRLINELLPEVGTMLPRDLSVRKLPSELCNVLARDPKSPFLGIVSRFSDSKRAVVTDTALEKAIARSLRPPIGALNQYRGFGSTPSDTDAMYRTMALYWGVVKEVFGDAWGVSPNKSRLMHSAGIRAMGMLMDQIMLRADGLPEPKKEIYEALTRIAPYCCWTDGVWDGLGMEWNEIQSIDGHINRLADYLCRLDRELSRKNG
ncbi:DGQHR domain-containing protein DpdB [Rhodospirillales bacterium]|nr:DGQHR domain-containing protein DpdB [Rhodospirillales bacterium]